MQTVFILGLAALILRELDILDYHIYYSDSTADLEKIYSRCIDDGSADNSSDIQMVSWISLPQTPRIRLEDLSPIA